MPKTATAVAETRRSFGRARLDKVVDRLSADLREAFPDLSGLSPRNLECVREFAAAWPNEAIVQGRLHNFSLREAKVEYALRDVASPIGVANWEKVLVETLPKEFEGVLPTVEQLEAELMPKTRSKR